MEAVVADPLTEDSVQGRGVDLATEGRGLAGAGVVHQHDEDVAAHRLGAGAASTRCS